MKNLEHIADVPLSLLSECYKQHSDFSALIRSASAIFSYDTLPDTKDIVKLHQSNLLIPEHTSLDHSGREFSFLQLLKDNPTSASYIQQTQTILLLRLTALACWEKEKRVVRLSDAPYQSEQFDYSRIPFMNLSLYDESVNSMYFRFPSWSDAYLYGFDGFFTLMFCHENKKVLNLLPIPRTDQTQKQEVLVFSLTLPNQPDDILQNCPEYNQIQAIPKYARKLLFHCLFMCEFCLEHDLIENTGKVQPTRHTLTIQHYSKRNGVKIIIKIPETSNPYTQTSKSRFERIRSTAIQSRSFIQKGAAA